ncbi:SPFH domain-containing protein [Marinibaculum pumilum]|uniref:SPFH domain-containing protein n=1 Tax=Marinibaculum pumilum TaxID=1766165 RepID=A0ABV7L9K1_9PROT
MDADSGVSGGLILILVLALVILVTIWRGIKIVPQSEKYVIERLGRLHKVLGPGLNLIVPFLDVVRHRVSVLERQLPHMQQDAITRDNVLLQADMVVFYRVLEPERTVYRIRDIDAAVGTTVAGIVRSEIGRLELDEVQSNRSTLNGAIKQHLAEATDDWGIAVTRAEVLDINLDAATREAMLQQLNAERARRAAVTQAEGEKRAMELRADAELYTAQKLAEARRISAEADAYATEVVAQAIHTHGTAAVEFEIRKRQVEAFAKMSDSQGRQTIVLPADLAEAFGTAARLFGGTRT